jgi:hypothetical protein
MIFFFTLFSVTFLFYFTKKNGYYVVLICLNSIDKRLIVVFNISCHHFPAPSYSNVDAIRYYEGGSTLSLNIFIQASFLPNLISFYCQIKFQPYSTKLN